MVVNTIFYSLAALLRKILFLSLENKIHICAPPYNILYISNDLEQTHYNEILFISSLTYQSIVDCVNHPMTPRIPRSNYLSFVPTREPIYINISSNRPVTLKNRPNGMSVRISIRRTTRLNNVKHVYTSVYNQSIKRCRVKSINQ